MNLPIIFRDRNYLYIAIGLLAAISAVFTFQQYNNSNQPKEIMIYAAIITATALTYQAAKMYLYSKQFARTPIKNGGNKTYQGRSR